MKKAETIFAEGMAGLAEIHEKKLTKTLTAVYREILKDFSPEDLQRGFARAAAELKFFPKPAEMLELIQGSRADRALQAWLHVQDAVNHLCANLSISFGDPRTHAVIEAMGGWVEVDNWPEDLQWKQKEFERIYLALQAVPAHTPAYLQGKDELYALARGRKWRKQPVLAGAQVRLAIEKKQAARPALPEPTKEEARKILAMISKRTGKKLLEAKP